MHIREATQSYETWLGQKIPLISGDLDLKHKLMTQGLFPFLRATFYRWVQILPDRCPEVMNAPDVLAVGDLHLENFATWRDIEGRLVWGVNDFDEACRMPYSNDLLRLSTSVALAVQENSLSINLEEACEALLSGYSQSLEKGGEPFVLAEEHAHLREMANSSLRDPAHYWQKFDDFPTVDAETPSEVKRMLEAALPEIFLSYRIVHRQAGLGSLGRQRYTALADWRGGKIAREAKQLAVSACQWAKQNEDDQEIYYMALSSRAVRDADPLISIMQGWLVRRLAPDCGRIELSDLPKACDENRLLRAMGWETANQHLGSPEAIPAVLADLKKRDGRWLLRAAETMVKATQQDWEDWKKTFRED
jgi:hypothetical protein